MWTAHFLEVPPISGQGQEYSFQAISAESSNWSWVHFEHSEGTEWFGAFRQGRVSRWCALASPDHRYVFVIAAGVLYCVDAETRTLAGSPDGCSFQGILAIPGTSDVAIADFTEVGIVNPRGIVWTTPRLAWDGIRLIAATESEVLGIAETGQGPAEEKAFTIDLVNRTVSGGHVDHFKNRPGRRAD